jgi:DNA-binding Lrp family transcriptional regulator
VAGNALKVHERLFGYPLISVNSVARRLGVSFPAANRLTERMVDIGILTEVTGHARNRVFSYAAYIALFSGE